MHERVGHHIGLRVLGEALWTVKPTVWAHALQDLPKLTAMTHCPSGAVLSCYKREIQLIQPVPPEGRAPGMRPAVLMQPTTAVAPAAAGLAASITCTAMSPGMPQLLLG